MLAKPTQQVAHGGGLRFENGSDYYKTIFNWIAQGVPLRRPGKGYSAPFGGGAEGDLHDRAGRERPR